MPAVGEQAVVFQTCQQRVQSPFHYDEMRFLETCYELGGVSGGLPQNEHNAELEHAFTHL